LQITKTTTEKISIKLKNKNDETISEPIPESIPEPIPESIPEPIPESIPESIPEPISSRVNVENMNQHELMIEILKKQEKMEKEILKKQEKMEKEMLKIQEQMKNEVLIKNNENVGKAEGKRQPISKALRDSVFTTYNQSSYDDAYCYVGCGEKITPKGNPFKTLRHKEGV
jgi:hypothetical protein